MRDFILGILAASMIFVCVGFIFLSFWEEQLRNDDQEKDNDKNKQFRRIPNINVFDQLLQKS